MITRRTALQGAALAGAAACAKSPEESAYSASEPSGAPFFVHGVASGDPGPDSVVIWTRFFNEALSSIAAERRIAWRVAKDPDFTDIVAEGETATGPARDWTVKALVEGLEPGRAYYYRFNLGDAWSDIGRTRTLPAGAVSRASFAVVSCSNYPFGFFNVYDLIARRDDLDAVIHLGDYIYEYGPDGYGGEAGASLGRPHDPPHEATTLDDYRRRHAQYKADPSSRAMHAAHPLIAIWDDHETANDSWSGGAENHDPETEGAWAARKRAALQAYYEWMPVREPQPGRLREALFRSFVFGDLLTLAAIETRLMARARPFDYAEIMAEIASPEDLRLFREETLWDPGREMLGAAQRAYLSQALAAAVRQPWRLIANQVIMADMIAPDLTGRVTEEDLRTLEADWPPARAFVESSALGLPLNFDAWDGYPAAREKFYALVRDAGAEGIVVVTGDTHSWWANDLRTRDGAHVGVELGTHSVTSPSPYRREFLGGKGRDYAMLITKENKSVRYLSGENHGYIALDFERDRAQARFMAVDTIESRNYRAFEKAAFAIRPGARFGAPKGLGVKERILFGR